MSDTEIKSYKVPLDHPAVCTVVPYSLCASNPEAFYRVNHCLQMPPGDKNEMIFTEPAGTINIKNCPVLIGKECISSVEELQSIANDLLSKPIYAEIDFFYLKERTNEKWADKYCVVVDTQHMYVRATLKRYLDEAIEMMDRGTKFSLQFSFASSIGQCVPMYFDPIEANTNKSRCFVSEGLNIHLTNHGRPICGLGPKAWWFFLALFPINIFGGICYWCYRNAKVKDVEYEVRGFPVKFLVDGNTLEFIVPDYASTRLH